MRLHRIHFLILFFLVITTRLSAQNDFGGTPCDFKFYDIQHTIEDSIEFYVEYVSEIDLSNENCSYTVAEDYYNIAPDMQTNTLCVIYICQKEPIENINYLDFFANQDLSSLYLEKIQLVFITDRRTGLWQSYETKEEIQNVFKLNIVQGIIAEE